MLNEPTTIAAAARLIAETLHRNYNQNHEPVFAAAGLDPERMKVAGSRYPWRRMEKLWKECVRVTGDPAFGLVVGNNIRPTTFHALGFSWIASRSLLESLQRLCRYYDLLSNAPYDFRLTAETDAWFLHGASHGDPDPEASRISMDALLIAILRLCQQASSAHFHALSVHFAGPAPADIDTYIKAFGAPVYFGQDSNGLRFGREELEAPLPGDNLELAIANDRIAEEYISALNPDRVASEVRKLLVELLPSGDASQTAIAQQMNRSLSTLQRQLAGEGTNYKEIREQTRAELAEQYVREGRYTLSQIAYLLGFSDQSNFCPRVSTLDGPESGAISTPLDRGQMRLQACREILAL